MRTRLVALVVSLLAALAVPAFAQQGTSEIGGRVTDEQGGALPGVSITLTNEETGAFREVMSGPDGSFFASQLKPGRYKLSLTATDAAGNKSKAKTAFFRVLKK